MHHLARTVVWTSKATTPTLSTALVASWIRTQPRPAVSLGRAAPAGAAAQRCYSCAALSSSFRNGSSSSSGRRRKSSTSATRSLDESCGGNTPRRQERSLSSSSSASPSLAPTKSSSMTVLGQTFPSDDYTNLPSSIVARLSPSPTLPYTPHHPLCLLREQIERQIGTAYTPIRAPSPIVSTALNFEDLGFPADHPGRSPTDTYYLNRSTCLRTHTSAHEVQTFRAGHERWLLTADVYRRDEIDASHYPIFHQMEGAAIFAPEHYLPGGRVERECDEMEAKLARANLEIEDLVDLQEAGGFQRSHDPSAAQLATRHLKATLNGLVLDLFGERHAFEAAEAIEKAGRGTGGKPGAEGKDKLQGKGATTAASIDPLRVRWIPATFPFTSPSYEVEVWFRGKWLEILGCGVVMDNTLLKAGVNAVDTPPARRKLGWAFGLGLERIAMVLYSIPDIRLFWSQDRRFLDQFVSHGQPAAAAADTGEIKQGVSAAGGATPSSRTRSNLVTFKPYSRFPPCYKDVSFWLPSALATGTDTLSASAPTASIRSAATATATAAKPPTFHENDFYEIVRDTVADLAEDVVKIDEFVHPKTGKTSLCYRINYRSMDRSLENEEVNELHAKVLNKLVHEMKLEIR